jgi:hypothetical protein
MSPPLLAPPYLRREIISKGQSDRGWQGREAPDRQRLSLLDGNLHSHPLHAELTSCPLATRWTPAAGALCPPMAQQSLEPKARAGVSRLASRAASDADRPHSGGTVDAQKPGDRFRIVGRPLSLRGSIRLPSCVWIRRTPGLLRLCQRAYLLRTGLSPYHPARDSAALS